MHHLTLSRKLLISKPRKRHSIARSYTVYEEKEEGWRQKQQCRKERGGTRDTVYPGPGPAAFDITSASPSVWTSSTGWVKKRKLLYCDRYFKD